MFQLQIDGCQLQILQMAQLVVFANKRRKCYKHVDTKPSSARLNTSEIPLATNQSPSREHMRNLSNESFAQAKEKLGGTATEIALVSFLFEELHSGVFIFKGTHYGRT